MKQELIDKKDLKELSKPIVICENGKSELRTVIFVSDVDKLPVLNTSTEYMSQFDTSKQERKSCIMPEDVWTLVRRFADTADSAADVGLLVQLIEGFVL